MHLALAHNLRQGDDEAEAERLAPAYVADVQAGLERLGHRVTPLELSGDTATVLERLNGCPADMVFNLAEAGRGAWREAYYPMLYEFLDRPYTGAGPACLGMSLDKRMLEEVLESRGVRVPRGAFVTEPEVPEGLEYPLLVKPNFGGSSMGIHQDSIVEGPDDAETRIRGLLADFPEGLDVEEYIPGRELTVGYLEAAGQPFLPPLEYVFPAARRRILDYETKEADGDDLETHCPAELERSKAIEVHDVAEAVVSALKVRDAARVDLRLRDDGRVYVIECNPLPGLRRVSPLIVAAAAAGISFDDVLASIVRSAAKRQYLAEVTA